MSSWVDLASTLPGLRGGRVHVVPAARLTELRAALHAAGFEILALDGERIRDQASFMREAARGLSLPDYFGHNWDALADCLGDLHDRPARRVAVLWTQAEQLARADLQALLDAALAFDRAADDAGPDLDAGREPLQLELFLLGDGPAFG